MEKIKKIKKKIKNKHRILGSNVCYIEKYDYKKTDEEAILQVTFERRPKVGKGANEQERGQPGPWP